MFQNKVSSAKPFCKVCFDAGKSEKEYTSHFVRSLPDLNGKTVLNCTTLLSTQCRYCGDTGHTAKFCKVIKNNIKCAKRNVYHETINVLVELAGSKKRKSVFAVLDNNDSESDDETDHTHKIRSQKKEKVVMPYKAALMQPQQPQQPVVKAANKQANKQVVAKTVAKKSWADYSDTDSDYDSC
jgi:hypothetical protein